jgi:hypothetical protein
VDGGRHIHEAGELTGLVLIAKCLSHRRAALLDGRPITPVSVPFVGAGCRRHYVESGNVYSQQII